VMEAVQFCRVSRACEMIAGRWLEKFDRLGNVAMIWISDTRKVFIGSVDALYYLLEPKIRADKDFEKATKEFGKDLENIFNKYAYTHWKTKEKFLPTIGSTIVLANDKTKRYEFVKGGWDMYGNLYFDKILEVYDLMFGELNCLIQRLGYFKKKAGF
ncbi:unnamed protein product, partial [marine sediment metagenome]